MEQTTLTTARNKNRDPKPMTMGSEEEGPETVRVLHQGIDRISISLFPDSKDYYESVFDALLYSTTEPIRWSSDHEDKIYYGLKPPYEMYNPGTRGSCHIYKFGIRCQDYAIEFAHPNSCAQIHHTPPLMFMPSKQFIYNNSIEKIVGLVENFKSEYDFERSHISYLEVCVDFLGWQPTNEDLTEKRFKCRAKCKRPYPVTEKNNRILEIYFGNGRTIEGHIYNKGAECRKCGNYWMLERIGCKLTDDLWRLEFRLRRRSLRQLGINTLEDLQNKKLRLWAYLTTEWLVHKIEGDVSPAWRTIQSIAVNSAPLVRNYYYPQTLTKRRESLVRQCAGYAALANRTNMKDVLSDLKHYCTRNPQLFLNFLEKQKIKLCY